MQYEGTIYIILYYYIEEDVIPSVLYTLYNI